MSGAHDDEPIFVRRWGGYAYNPNNPIGRALIAVSAVLLIAYLYDLFDSAQWSEGELRDAVHESARHMEAEPQTLRGYYGYEGLIGDAIEETGEGPEPGLVHVEKIEDSDAAGVDADAFEITTDDVETTYCMRVSPPRPETGMSSLTVELTVDVAEGPC
ncbi:hypothetical protein [Streptomyces sp. NPDC018833]|uniref:hypothetical protein n=1 Tax=Streptomyces sp. NPDC018833 TaxID=3365053 RepID=UPI0037BA538D